MKYFFPAILLVFQASLFSQDAAPFDLLGNVRVYHSAANTRAAVVVNVEEHARLCPGGDLVRAARFQDHAPVVLFGLAFRGRNNAKERRIRSFCR